MVWRLAPKTGNPEHGKQLLRVKEQELRVAEQKARLEVAHVKGAPASAPPPPAVGAASAPVGPADDSQFRAVSAALQLKTAYVRAGVMHEDFVDDALVRLGAVDHSTAIAVEQRGYKTQLPHRLFDKWSTLI